LFALLLPLKTLLKLTSNVFRGVELIRYDVIVNDLLNPLARVGAVGVVLLLGYSLIGVVSALAIGGAIVLAIAIVFLVSSIGLKPSFSRDQVSLREYYDYTLPLSVQGIGALFYQRADVFMVGYFLDDSAVGVYTIAMLLSTLTLFPLNGFNQLAPSVISRLYGADEHEELQRVYETITRWTFSASLLIAIGTISYRTELLSVFGPAFTTGQRVLILFVIGQLVSASVGPSGNLLMMTNHQYLTSANVIVGGAANVVLNYYFIQQFGLIGAALATATGLGVLNSVLLVEVWYFEGLYPYSASFIKPMLAGIATAAVMAGFSAILSSLPLLFAGGAAGSVTFVLVLIGLGVEDEERKFAEQIIRSRL
jgi:O-antigen/teichoic acid export membrane protein